MKKIGKAVQMYTVRDEAAVDFEGTIRRIAEMGYDGIEFCGYGPKGPNALKLLLDELGVQAVSNHINLGNLQQEIEDAQILGVRHFATGLWQEFHDGPDGVKRAIEMFNTAGREAADAGIRLCYHNHDWEFVSVDGKPALDLFYEQTRPEWVGAELDVFWVHRGGLDPAAYIRKYTGRVPVLHVKDASGEDEQPFAEVGHGQLAMASIFEAAEASGTEWFIVEQDRTSRTPFESIRMSVEYLSSMGY